MTHTLAAGCCSACTPCSHQKRDPSTICDVCRAVSPTVAEWLANNVRIARTDAAKHKVGTPDEQWKFAQAVAYERALEYAKARLEKLSALDASTLALREITDEDINWLAREAIRSNNRTLSRIAAALLVGRP